MVKNFKKMKKVDLTLLLSWFITFEMMNKKANSLGKINTEEKITKYDDLYLDIMKIDQEYIDISSLTSFEFLDEIIYHLYGVYQNTTVKSKIDHLINDFFNTDEMESLIKETQKQIDLFKKTYEKYLYNFDFLTDRTKNLQKEFLQEKLNEYIKKEQFELCIDIKNKLKTLEK